MAKIIVSACLLGENCKYSGGNNLDPKVTAYLQDKEVIPVCPETLAGLGIPRVPIEVQGTRVISRDGRDVTEAIDRAVATILSQLQGEEISCAILKARSPTCGVRQIYDGSFTGTLVDGMGKLAQALKQAGYRVINNEMLEEKENAGI